MCTYMNLESEIKLFLLFQHLLIPGSFLERPTFNHSDSVAMRFMVDLAEERTGIIILRTKPASTLLF